MKALALVDAPDHVCCRYRLRAFEPALAAAGWTLTVEALAPGPLARSRQLALASRCDVVILQRKLLPAWQLALLRRTARRLVYDFDDAVLYRDSYDPRGPNCPRRAARFARTVRHADAVLAGNDFLAECARAAGARAERIQILPTCVDPRRYRAAAPALPRDGLHLVWVGSSSTLQGLEQRRTLWEYLGRALPGLRLRVIGDRFPHFETPPVIPVLWKETTEAAELAAGDVGISWVPDDLWSRGKCGLKLLQYQAAGLPVVANPVGVHLRIIAPGVSGFLAEEPDEWLAALRALAADPGLRARMGRAARAAVAADYAVARWGPAFVAAVAGAPSPHAAPADEAASDRDVSRALAPGLR